MNTESVNVNHFILLVCSNEVPINEIFIYLKHYRGVRKFLVNLLHHLLWRENKIQNFVA